MSNKVTTRLEPHVRIARAGFKVGVKHVAVDGVFKHGLYLVKDSAPYSEPELASRNGKYTLAEMERRINRGLVNAWTDTYCALLRLADMAEQLVREGV